jgi:hypothetical protein
MDEFLAPRKIGKDVPTSKEFWVLNVTETTGLDDLSKMSVRVHSARDFHRRKREKALSGAPLQRPDRKRGVVSLGRMQRFKIGTAGMHATRRQRRPCFIEGQLEDQGTGTLRRQEQHRSEPEAEAKTPLLENDNCALLLLGQISTLGTGVLAPLEYLSAPHSERARSLLDRRK